ncbi:hypothetical protein [Oceanicola sp. S124]|uniref:hypothetical protein n=1 Tax=Oceanicola sp. S124 TaxID=1042378 RepID=UPI00025593F1|nr:hypothetical protein [Oceanicola sp. S124]
MSRNTAPTPDSETSGHLDIAAAELAEILAGQVAGLRGLTSGLEDALSASLCSCKPLTEEAFLTLQRIDYMRQALKDLEGILQRFGPSLDWAEGQGLTHAALQDSVDMGDSIKPILKASSIQAGDETSSHDAGDLDLW